MHLSDEEILDRWLAAEREGREGDAETTLALLLEALPPLMPPAGFTERALARALPLRPSLHASFGFRALVALSLAAAGLILPWLSELLRSMASLTSFLWSPGDLVRWGTGALIALSQTLATMLELWSWLLGVGRALSVPFATPAMALISGGCLLVSLVAFYVLRNLILRDRSWIYVDLV